MADISSPSKRLKSVIHAGSSLTSTETPEASSALKEILIARLREYYARSDEDRTNALPDALEDLQTETALASMTVVERANSILCVNDTVPHQPSEAVPPDVPMLGTRDLALLRTLLAIVFKWGVDTCLARLVHAWRYRPDTSATLRPRITEPASLPDDHRFLSSLTVRLVSLVLPQGPAGMIAQTHIASSLIDRHAANLMTPCLVLGWIPKGSAASLPAVDILRQFLMRLLAILTPSRAIAALGSVMSVPLPLPDHAQKACRSLLSRQLTRPEGVQGLYSAIFGEEDASDDVVPHEKLEHVSRLLLTPPSGSGTDVYFPQIIPRVLTLLESSRPQAHRRAAAFTISRMLSPDNGSNHHRAMADLILQRLHEPFRSSSGSDANQDTPPPALQVSQANAEENIRIIATIIANMDPSPQSLELILSPIAPELYSILAFLDGYAAADPDLKESVQGLLVALARVISTEDCIAIFWRILKGEGAEWCIGSEGKLSKAPSGTQRLSLFTPQNLQKAEQQGELDPESNYLGLRPDPTHFNTFLNAIDRADVLSALFVQLLDAYHAAKREPGVDPTRIILYLQLIVQMQKDLSNNSSSQSLLKQPTHILSFVKHALEPEPSVESGVGSQNDLLEPKGPNLRIVPQDDPEEESEDSDDEVNESNGSLQDTEMTETAIDLLLSVLEANENLSARTAPILHDIFVLLDPLANDTAHPCYSIAREARLVMTARLASTSTVSSQDTQKDEARDAYQKALRLLQDPLLPVRAHGLLLLRELVSPTRQKGTRVRLDHAFVPAILDIFLQTIQDDDSYMFLNAVQGLVAMVDGYGHDVLKSLVRIYTQGLGGVGANAMTVTDLDTRVRVGEVLAKVVKRSADAFALHVSTVVPPLLHVLRNPVVPTTLRTSNLSVLAECISANALAMLPFTSELTNAMLDLLQVESTTPSSTTSPPETAENRDAASTSTKETTDDKPLSSNTKLPPLRRAAVHFLSILIKTQTERVYDGQEDIHISPAEARRAQITLSYAAATDSDNVMKVMAREASEALDALQRATVGV